MIMLGFLFCNQTSSKGYEIFNYSRHNGYFIISYSQNELKYEELTDLLESLNINNLTKDERTF